MILTVKRQRTSQPQHLANNYFVIQYKSLSYKYTLSETKDNQFT